MNRLRFVLLVLGAIILGWAFGTVLGPSPPDRALAQEAVGPETCADCHEERVQAFVWNPHAVLDTKGLAKKANAAFSCVSCHGDASQHIEEGGGEGTIFAFKASDRALTKTEKCLTCHGETHPQYLTSNHAKGGLDCTSCHTIHLPVEDGKIQRVSLQPGGTESCRACHGEIFAKFQLNERHRLQEGILSCTTCHDPHAPATRERLGGFKQEACLQCHTDKQGPFIFEHGSVRVEGCTACHDPHGSVNRHQLTFQNVADLCYSCHTEVPGFHWGFPPAQPRFNSESQCTSCHATIHGSNLSPVFLK